MKRSSAERSTNSGSGPGRPKRSKTSQACASCRKHKTRCELPSEPGISRCHRCNVLQLACSFEGSEMIFTGHITGSGHINGTSGPSRAPQIPAHGVLGLGNNDLPQSPPEESAPPDPSKYNPDAFTAEELIMGPRRLEGEEEDSGPGYWATSPMGAIWDIMRKRSTTTQTDSSDSFQSGEVLTDDQVHYLMNLYVLVPITLKLYS
jgi:hypothetical protein